MPGRRQEQRAIFPSIFTANLRGGNSDEVLGLKFKLIPPRRWIWGGFGMIPCWDLSPGRGVGGSGKGGDFSPKKKNPQKPPDRDFFFFFFCLNSMPGIA